MTEPTRTRPVLGLLLAAALLALSACGSGGESESSSSAEAPSSEQPSAGSGTEPDVSGIPEVVAEVNGEEVTRDEFVPTYEAQFQQAAMQAQMGGGEAPDEQALQEQTADSLVDAELLRQEAASRGIEVSDEAIDDKLTELAEQNQLGSAQALLDALEKQGTTEDQARSQVETQVLVEGLVEDEVGAIEPTEKDLRALYAQVKQQQAQMGKQAQPAPPYDKVKPQLEQQAVSQEQNRVAQELVEELRQDADITINL
jgi:peptidyl-prolyl cis-trans isomerase SurA